MKLAVALVPIAALFACSSPSNPAKAEPVMNQQIIDRYTHERNIERLGNLDEPDPDAGAKVEMPENIPASARVS